MDSHQLLLLHEARYWLSKGYNNAASIKQLRAMLREKRAEKGVEQTIEEMRRQWVRRHEWLVNERKDA